MADELEFQAGDLIRVTLPELDDDLQFVIGDMHVDGDTEITSLIPDPDNAGTLPWE
ncbi:hypothetical protein K1T35_48100 (plasmid) [Pseudonocardia sp. DSM 110487]|uniref:hypothetical protein n=1 Tax=Pseudonocardia sp. DSM 110487 TaxID=2865833 RepID=UPI001C6A2D4F|nr:hypothetical protein [Pseudonocardia sp. DSM 110487]QYN41112.1 hypothetical protein K1T35_48100 [Pseudonocardia sp. DSM 110487]